MTSWWTQSVVIYPSGWALFSPSVFASCAVFVSYVLVWKSPLLFSAEHLMVLHWYSLMVCCIYISEYFLLGAFGDLSVVMSRLAHSLLVPRQRENTASAMG